MIESYAKFYKMNQFFLIKNNSSIKFALKYFDYFINYNEYY
jgi:hypothetical protein